jgi:hypothetical protein
MRIHRSAGINRMMRICRSDADSGIDAHLPTDDNPSRDAHLPIGRGMRIYRSDPDPLSDVHLPIGRRFLA